MVRMIIADDERLIRESLYQLIDWASVGVEVVATAENGLEALEKTMALQPDILLSDIEMPEMSGIDLVRSLREQGCDCKVIFLTAYSEFSYAQSAIRYGVTDYILKPIDEQQLINSVAACAGTVRSARQDRATLHRASLAQQLMVNDALRVCLTEPASQSEGSTGILENLHLMQDDAVCHGLICIRGCSADEVRESIPELPPVHTPTQYLVTLSSEEILLLWQWEAPVSVQLEGSLRRFAAKLQFRLPSHPKISVSRIHPGTQLRCLYPECTFAFLLPQFGTSSEPLCFSQVDAMLPQHPFDASSEALASVLTDSSQDTLSLFLNNYFLTTAVNGTIYDLSKVRLRCISLMEGLGRIFSRSSLPAEIRDSAFLTHLQEQIAGCSAIDAVYQLMQVALFQLQETCQRASAQSRLVRQVLEYVQQNYKIASLTDVATKLYVSPGYLSRIFANEMNESFSRYLLQYRIERAKELLHNPRHKIYDVAEAVGYSDVAHFSKAFKQVEGISPAKYREQI